MTILTTQQVFDAELADWRKLSQRLHARFATGDFVTGTRFVTAISDAAEDANHHPDVALTYGSVEVSLMSHDSGGLTDRDVALARTISGIARDRGIAGEPEAVRVFELALDTANIGGLGPFWQAVFGGELTDDEVIPASPDVPLLWFQGTEPHDEPRQRFHVDLWVPHDRLDELVARAVGAGGTIASDTRSPAFVVVADPDGNKVCFCTCLERD